MRISDWSSDVCSSDLLRVWLAYGVSYAGLVVTHAALLIILAWLSLFVPDTGSVHEATVIGIWFVAGISASLAAVHLVRALSPATALKQYLWISLVLIAALAAANLGLPVQIGRASCRESGGTYV